MTIDHAFGFNHWNKAASRNVNGCAFVLFLPSELSDMIMVNPQVLINITLMPQGYQKELRPPNMVVQKKLVYDNFDCIK